jgi:hypothetical protein
MHVRWLDEIDCLRFDVRVTHLQGALIPADQPKRQRGSTDGPGPAASTVDGGPGSGESAGPDFSELFTPEPRRGRDATSSAVRSVIRAGWKANQLVAAVTIADIQEGDEIPSTGPMGGGRYPPSLLGCSWRSQGWSWSWEP